MNTEQRIVESLMAELKEAKAKIAALEEENKIALKGLEVLVDAGLAAVGAYNELASKPCPKCGEKL